MPSDASIEIRKSLHKETQASELSVAEQRAAWDAYAETLALAKGTTEQSETIAGVPCLWIRHADIEEDAILIHLHGGGFVDGSLVTHREFASRLAQTTGCPVLLIGYRLAPENPFPAALEDAVAVYRELVETRHRSASGLVLGGDSSGGSLAVSTMMRLRDLGLALPRCAYAISGAFDLTLSGDSMRSCDEIDPCLSYEALRAWTKLLVGEVALSDPELSPLLGELAGLPPLLLQVGEREVWRDDSIRLAAKVREAGGAAKLKIWEAMWHVWPMWADLPEAQQALEEIRDFLR